MLIGLTGYAQNGKDSAADVLDFPKYAFAEDLRTMALAVDPTISLFHAPPDIIADLIEAGHVFVGPYRQIRLSKLIDTVGYERAKLVPDCRRFYQNLGTDGVRNVLGDDTWVKNVGRKLQRDGIIGRANEVLAPWSITGNATIPDVRFHNEEKAVHRWGGQVWRVNRWLDGEHTIPFDNGLSKEHPSEAQIDSLQVDVVIDACSLEELSLRVALLTTTVSC